MKQTKTIFLISKIREKANKFILADLAQRLGIRIVHVENLILTEQLSEELAAALSPLTTPESMN